MLQRLRQISISSSLRGAFLTGALLTLIVSSVSLYSRPLNWRWWGRR